MFVSHTVLYSSLFYFVLSECDTLTAISFPISLASLDAVDVKPRALRCHNFVFKEINMTKLFYLMLLLASVSVLVSGRCSYFEERAYADCIERTRQESRGAFGGRDPPAHLQQVKTTTFLFTVL